MLAPPDPRHAPPALQRSSGRVEVVWKRRGEATTADRVFEEGAAKVRLPRDHGRGLPDAALINVGGGLTGGDTMDYRLLWKPRTAAGATTQAAERIYRAIGDDVRITTGLDLGDDAWAEWLPQETILFEGAALDRRLVVDVAPTARLLAVEPLVFGRLAMGESVDDLDLRDRIEVRVDGKVVWLDATRLAPPVSHRLDHPALGAGARAIATLLYVGADAADRLAALRRLVDEAGVPSAVTCLSPVLVARFRHAEPLALRRALVHVLSGARAELRGLPARLPRLWHG